MVLCYSSPNGLRYLPCIYSSISAWTNGYLLNSTGYNTILSSFILLFNLSEIWPLGALSDWILSSFDMLFLCEYFLTVWYHKMFQVHHIFSMLQLESVTSLRSLGSFYWKTMFQNQGLGTKCAYC